jgi:sortase A
MTIRLQWRRNHDTRKKNLIRWAARFFFAAGCAAIALCAVWYWQACVYQQTALAKVRASQPREQADPDRPRPGEPILEIDIPRIGLSAAVVERVSAKKLRLAVGHVPGTALPGGAGNVAIAGHRDTFFRKLRFVRRGDAIRLVTRSAIYDYAVEWARIAAPSDTSPLRNSLEPALTLVTCYPFYFVGPAPQRFIVRARPITRSAPADAGTRSMQFPG